MDCSTSSTQADTTQVAQAQVQYMSIYPVLYIYIYIYITNQKWFSVVCTLIDNDIRHHSGQNVVDLFFTTIFNAKESVYFRA